ncbi:hypothetical protein ABPG72_021796 [Tetrahymena utriculariae]
MNLFASLSHELRTPLNCSISMLEVLKDEMSANNQKYIDEYLNPALFSNKLLLNQINDILDFVQMDSGKFKYSFIDFDIQGLLKDCQKLVNMQANMKNISIKVVIQKGVPERICSDPDRIRQILLNFLSNDLKFTIKGYVEIGINSLGKNLYEIYVKDTGIGIMKDNLEKIFQFCNKINYNKNDESLNQQGCGLALTISNSIANGLVSNQIKESGIKVQSEYGNGSTFSIVIQDMDFQFHSKQLIKDLVEISLNNQKTDKITEQINQEGEVSPQKNNTSKRSFVQLKSFQKSKNLNQHQINPSSVIIVDEMSLADQTNQSVDFLKNSYLQTQLDVQKNKILGYEKVALKSSPFQIGNNHQIDSALIIEFEEENQQNIQIHSHISIKNNLEQYKDDELSSLEKEQQSNSNPQKIIKSQYKQLRVSMSKSPRKLQKSINNIEFIKMLTQSNFQPQLLARHMQDKKININSFKLECIQHIHKKIIDRRWVEITVIPSIIEDKIQYPQWPDTLIISKLCKIPELSSVEVEFVYSSTPNYNYQFQNQILQNVALSKDSKIIATYLGESRVIFIDRNYKSTIYQIPLANNTYASAIGVTSNGLNVFLAIESMILIYQVQQNSNETVILSTCRTNGSTISQFIFNNNENFIITLTTQQLIQIYDIRNLSNISLSGEFIPNSNLNLMAALSSSDNLLYVAAGYSGLNIYSLTYSSNKSVMEYSLIYYNQPGQNMVDLAKSQNDHIIYAVDSIQGVFIFNNLDTSDQIKNQSTCKYFGLGKFKIKLQISSIGISPFDQFIFVGVRSQGIYIFNIEHDAMNPVFFQLIQFLGNPLKIQVYCDLNAIIISNSQSIKIYSQKMSNINSSEPNLLNIHKKQQIEIGNATQNGKCLIYNISNLMYGPFNKNSIKLVQYKSSYFKQSINANLNSYLSFTNSLPSFNSSYFLNILNLNGSQISDFLITSGQKMMILLKDEKKQILLLNIQSNSSKRLLPNINKLNNNLTLFQEQEKLNYLWGRKSEINKKFETKKQSNNTLKLLDNIQAIRKLNQSIQYSDQNSRQLNQQQENKASLFYYSFYQQKQMFNNLTFHSNIRNFQNLKAKPKNKQKRILENQNSIQLITFDQHEEFQKIEINKEETLLLFSISSGFYLIETINYKIITNFKLTNITGLCKSAVFSPDSKYVLLIYQSNGLYFVNIQNKNQPFVANYYQTSAGEMIISSKILQYIYFVDGINGLIIIDANYLPSIKIVGNYFYNSWITHIALSFDENYGVISSVDQNQMVIVNLEIKSNPYLSSAQNFDRQQEQIYYSCFDQNQQLLFAVGTNGIYSYPTSSNLIINVQLLSVSEKQNIFLISENNFVDELLHSFNLNKSFLKVGLYYEFEIVPIYQKENQIFQEMLIWKNNQLSKLPSWIKATQDLKNVTIFVSKELLQKGYTQGILTLVIKNCFQLSQTDFLISTSFLNITELESQAIWSFLRINKIVNNDFCFDYEKDNILSENALDLFDLLKNVSDSNSYNRTMLILSNIQQILRQSIDYSPIKFNIESSLRFDINDSVNIIKSQSSDQITMILSFEQNSNLIFVNMNYQNSLIFLYGQQSNTISLKSTTQNLNQILRDKIYFYIDIKDDGDNDNNNGQKNQTIGNQLIKIQLSDGINYDVQILINLEQVNFLQLKRSIEVINPLQKQVNFISDGASFAIETQISIEFEQNTFLDPDLIQKNQAQNGIGKISAINDLSIIYEFYLMNQGGQYEIASSNYFLKFDSQNMRLIGSPPSSLLFQKQNYMIVAKTAYCKAYDTFYLKFDQIPLSYAFNIFLKIISPIAFIIGIYQKRYVFYNMINKKKTLYSQEKAYIYQIYRKKITLIGDELIITQLFFEKFLKIIGQPTSQLYKEIIGNQELSNVSHYNQDSQNDNLKSSNQCQKIKEAQIQRQRQQYLQNNILEESIRSQDASLNPIINDKISNDAKLTFSKKINQVKQEQNLILQAQNQMKNAKKKIKKFSSQDQINLKPQNSSFDFKEQDQNKQINKKLFSLSQIEVWNEQCQDITSKKYIQNLPQQSFNKLNANYFSLERKSPIQEIGNKNNFQLKENIKCLESNNYVKQNLKNAIKILHSNKNIVEEAAKKLNNKFKIQRSKSLINRIQELNKLKKIEKQEQQKKVAYSARYIINKLCIQENGNIDIHKVIYFMMKKELDVVLRLKKHRVLEYKDEFQNQNSRFYYSLKAFIARYLLQQDSKTKYLYKFLKNLAINDKLSQNTPNDWYKKYIEIVPTNEIDDFGMCIPFSKIKIKYVYLKNILQQLQLFNIINYQQPGDKILLNCLEGEQDEKEISQQLSKFKINFYLIKEVLIADALGLVFEKEHFSSQKCFGESLHIHNEQILSIEAFQVIKTSKVMWLRKMCNLMYSRIPISKHLSLPTWISFDCKNGVLYLEGTPSHQDVHDILIRVYDISKQIILQYNLSIQDDKKKSKESLKLLLQNFNNNSTINTKNTNQPNKIIEQNISSQFADKNQAKVSYQLKYQINPPNSSFSSFKQKQQVNKNYFDSDSNLKVCQLSYIQNSLTEQEVEQKEKQISEAFKLSNMQYPSLETNFLKQSDSFSTYASPQNYSFYILNNPQKKVTNKKIMHKQSSFKTEHQQQACYENNSEFNIQVPSQDNLNIYVPDSLKIKNLNKSNLFNQKNNCQKN